MFLFFVGETKEKKNSARTRIDNNKRTKEQEEQEEQEPKTMDVYAYNVASARDWGVNGW
jgi:hypothetical protein